MTQDDKVNLMNLAPRCGAKARSGHPCKAPAIKGKRRCKFHGGRSTGAPGNQNALVHGMYSGAMKARRVGLKFLAEQAKTEAWKEFL